MVNSSQSMVATYQYDPFGNPISSSGTLASANVYRFSSKEIHVKSGMYYYGYRFYDPNLQRWLNRDPIQEKGRLNLYRFVRNSPTRFLDTFGKDIFILPPFPGQFPYPPKPGPGPQEDDPPKPKPVPPPKPNPTPTPNPKPPRRPNPRCEDQEQDCQLLDGSQPDVCIYVCDGPEPWVGHTAKKSPNSVCAPTANSGDVKPGVPGFPDFPTE